MVSWKTSSCQGQTELRRAGICISAGHVARAVPCCHAKSRSMHELQLSSQERSRRFSYSARPANPLDIRSRNLTLFINFLKAFLERNGNYFANFCIESNYFTPGLARLLPRQRPTEFASLLLTFE